VLFSLLPLVLGSLLGWSGSAKLPRHRAARQAAGSALEHILPGPRAVLALRAVGVAEVALAAVLLLRPLSPAGAAGTAALGACFLGYLGYARVTVPESSCGCTSARQEPVTWRSFARAGLVAAGGACCGLARSPWWSVARHPAAATAVIAAAAAGLAAMSSDFDELWLLPVRRMGLRLFGHPLAGTSGEVPLAATVELLEDSLAWQAAGSIVRSGLVDHWDSDGWRILRYSGVHDGLDGPRPVSVVFALDATATSETVGTPVVRASIVDEERDQIVALPLPDATGRALQPTA
jgi:hypothetical protein